MAVMFEPMKSQFGGCETVKTEDKISWLKDIDWGMTEG